MIDSRTRFTFAAYFGAAVFSLGIGLQAGLGVGLAWFGGFVVVVTGVISVFRYLGDN